ncbi:MAG: TonB-dependent receptor [Cellvibrionaceae bacterium]|nr:TonB-dependent receptor [Cellvibrionaceae bacterium]
MTKNRLINVSLLSVLVGLHTQAMAQDSDDDSFAGLEEVVVTAQRKSENVQDAAIPISVATAADLQRAGAVDTSALNNIAPAISVIPSGGSLNSYIVRGVGNLSTQAYTDGAVAINVDEVYIGRSSSTTGSFLDLERVEVLKGPQGTLYGRNATGGAVNIIPQKPILGETSGYINASLGNYESYKAEGAVNFSVSDTTAVRFAATAVGDDGYNDDGSYQKEDFALRAQIFSEINDSASVRLAVDYAETNGTGVAGIPEGTYSFVPPEIPDGEGGFIPIPAPSGPLDSGQYAFTPAPAGASDPRGGFLTDAAQSYLSTLEMGPSFTTQDGNESDYGQNNVFMGFNAEINIETALGELVIIPAFRKSTFDETSLGPGFKLLSTDDESEQSSFEMRLSNSSGPVDWILGAYYFDEDISGFFAPSQFTLASHQNYETGTESEALFGRATFNLTHAFRLVAGVRYTNDDKYFDGTSNVIANICFNDPVPPSPTPSCAGGPNIPAALLLEDVLAEIASDPTLLPGGPIPGAPAGSQPIPPGLLPTAGGPPIPFGSVGNFLVITPTVINTPSLASEEVTYRFAGALDVAEDSLLYASYETGYRSGGFSFALGRETYEPEYLDAITVGSKNRFFDNRLQLNAELYHWTYEDQQVSHFGIDTAGTTVFVTENIGETKIQGLDLDVLFQATSSTIIKASIQFLDTNLDDFSYDIPDLTGLPPVTGCDFSAGSDANGPNFTLDCSDRNALFSPEWSVNAGIEQDISFSDFVLTLTGDARYRDEQVIGYDYLPTNIEDSYVMFDVSATLRPEDGNWHLSLYGNNVTDEEVRAQNFYVGSVGGLSSSWYAPPATYGVRFGLEF